MGAAGILETIISLRCIEAGETLPSKGYEELGVSANICISDKSLKIKGQTLLKLISGFGGCNAAMLYRRGECRVKSEECRVNIRHTVKLSSKGSVLLDGKAIAVTEKGRDMLTLLYKQYVGDYPRYYKMDILSKVAFICSELLLQAEGQRDEHKEDRAVILFNHSSAIVSDRAFLSTISEEYYPSPSAFVYTLPNIATGEIAIRNGYHGETSFYILPCKSAEIMDMVVKATLRDNAMRSVISGWVDCDDENNFEAEMMIGEK
jgi:3-oxoacyl-[acyl-carrier-protein] synthase-1